MKRLLGALRAALWKVVAPLVLVAEAVGHWFSAGGDDLLIGGSRWLLTRLADDPQGQRALVQAYLTVSQGVLPYRQLALGVLGASAGVLLLAVLLPPLFARLLRPRATVFVSFHRSREAEAQALQAAMEAAGITALRMPFRAGATHQEVVGTPIDGIRRSHLVVCLPGPQASFVDHEVYAATALEKPMAFVVSDTAGRLPDSADKCYPVFRLEALQAQAYASLVQFLRHVAGDLRSTLAVVGEALGHPAVSVPVVWLAMLAVLGAVGLLGLSLLQVWDAGGERLARLALGHAAQVQGAKAVGALLLFLLMLLALAALSYAALVLLRLAAQFRARGRMRRASAGAAFRRDEWVGLVPGLAPGEALYEALFDTAPQAHHEARPRPALATVPSVPRGRSRARRGA